jgi:hypothetical protein
MKGDKQGAISPTRREAEAPGQERLAISFSCGWASLPMPLDQCWPLCLLGYNFKLENL